MFNLIKNDFDFTLLTRIPISLVGLIKVVTIHLVIDNSEARRIFIM